MKSVFARGYAATLTLLLSLFSVQTLATDAFPRPDTQVLKVASSLFDETSADFMVTLPVDYQTSPDKHYVVMVGLHPRSHLLLTGMHDWMSHNGGWPWLETIIVTAPDGHKGLGKLKSLAIEEQGNQLLLDFFERDLLPAINQQYRTNGFKILNGFVGDAGLSLYTLINRPQLFNGYIAASPVLSGDFAYVLADAPKKLAEMDKTMNRFLFVSTSDSGYEQGQLQAFSQLDSLLKQHAAEGLHYKVQRFDGSYYMTQPVLATAMAVEMMFDDAHQTVAADSPLAQQGAKAVLGHYQHLSKAVYGFEVSATASLSRLAKAQLAATPDKAIETLQLAVEHYPNDPHAHAALGETYLTLKHQAKAQQALNKAMSLTQHPFWLNKWGKMLAAAKQ